MDVEVGLRCCTKDIHSSIPGYPGNASQLHSSAASHPRLQNNYLLDINNKAIETAATTHSTKATACTATEWIFLKIENYIELSWL